MADEDTNKPYISKFLYPGDVLKYSFESHKVIENTTDYLLDLKKEVNKTLKYDFKIIKAKIYRELGLK